MPFLTIKTNAANKDKNLVDDAAKLVAEILHKPLWRKSSMN